MFLQHVAESTLWLTYGLMIGTLLTIGIAMLVATAASVMRKG